MIVRRWTAAAIVGAAVFGRVELLRTDHVRLGDLQRCAVASEPARPAPAPNFRPTIIRLDFRHRPLIDVVQALNERHDLDLSVRLEPAPDPFTDGVIPDESGPGRFAQLLQRSITLETDVPFWRAMDLLAEAADVRYGLPAWTDVGSGRGTYEFFTFGAKQGPICDHGPFRVQVAEGITSSHCEDMLENPYPKRSSLALVVLPEPGFAVHQTGAVAIDEIIDKNGNPLAVRSATWPELAPDSRASDRVNFTNCCTSIRVKFEFAAPVRTGTVFRRLRGRIPVAVVTKRPNPHVIPLNAGTHAVSTSAGFISAERLVAPSAKTCTVTVTFHMMNRGHPLDPERPDFTEFQPQLVWERIELYDANGRKVNYTGGREMSGGIHSCDLVVPLLTEEGPATGPVSARMGTRRALPTELRYCDYDQAAIEIPFDLQGVAVP